MKTSMLKLAMPLAAAICVAAPMTSFAEAKQATLLVAGYTGSTTLTDFQALVKLSNNDAYGFAYADCAANDGSGTVSGGTLKVANELRIKDLNDCIVVNGGECVLSEEV